MQTNTHAHIATKQKKKNHSHYSAHLFSSCALNEYDNKISEEREKKSAQQQFITQDTKLRKMINKI